MMKLGLFGYGVVGGGVGRIADGRNDMEVGRILVLPHEKDVDPRTVTNVQDILNDKSIDTVIEVMGGIHPAFEFVSAALKAGKNVVTANKALVAAYYKELLQLSEENGVTFRCTAAVGGGIPWLVNLSRCRRVDKILNLWGIMNGTTNYILSSMTAQDVDFADVLKEAQALGYAEADPTADIDGHDIRRKLAISVGVAYDAALNESLIPTFGIRRITAADIKAFRSMDRTCKLIAYGEQTEEGVAAYVEPTLLTNDRLETAVDSNFNLISYESENAGIQSYYGQGAGRFPTAYNVVNDCIDILQGEKKFYTEKHQPAEVHMESVSHPYYVRTQNTDAFLDSVTAEKGEGWVITKPVSVAEMHSWAAQYEDAFFAGIR